MDTRKRYPKGKHPRRDPARPFSKTEKDTITLLSMKSVWELIEELPHQQATPRFQRLIQEAIERKRAGAGL